ncbi:trigger factor [Campylobacter insulaenigrae]|uniref:trigger factor n=1 Tax=Campylobacter insulaenigrae TaxID=260714 RepID=UPI0021537F6C|nr:trigger factor [Campylobacter insulaenigrae]MCR6578514.1 trigger factor [Campylobacter insulaenigrae]MCR6587890.1 trigger factor [Campylobacter insulaenigrae]
MEVTAKLLDFANANATIKIAQEVINNEIEKLAKKASKTIKMDGFRAGKVPVATVIKRYGKELTKDAEQDLFKNAIDNILKEVKKDVKDLVGEPYFETFDRKDNGIEATMILSFKPEVKIENYEELIPAYSTPKVTQKEIDAKKEELLKRYATPETIKEDRAIKEGDFVKFDFEGFVDDKAFDGGKAQNYVLEIGSKQFIPGFEDGMIGLKKNDEKDINVVFPKEYGAAHLAGKDAVFKVKIHEIQELKMPELNDEILKSLLPDEKEVSVEKLDAKIKEQIKNEKLFKLINDELKNEFAEALVNKFDFVLPKNIVEQETDMQFRNSLRNLSEEELKEFKDEAKYKEKRESFKEDAQKSVKLTFIIDELAKLRNIQVSDQELIQAVYFEAYRYGVNPQEHLDNYKKQGALPAIKMALIEEKLFADIFKKNDKKKTEKESEK